MLDRLRAIDRAGILRHRLDRTRIAMVGHSLGGSIAANVMLADRRVDVGVNYDGDYFLAAASARRSRPLMTMTGGADDNQRAFFARQRSGGLLVTLAGAQHESFTDLSYLGALLERTRLSRSRRARSRRTRPSRRSGRTPARSWPTTCWDGRRAAC